MIKRETENQKGDQYGTKLYAFGNHSTYGKGIV